MSSPDVVADYLSKQNILIADTNSSSRAGIAKALVDMGARTTKVRLAGSSEWAHQLLDEFQPSIIVSDFSLDTISGIDLFQHPKFSLLPLEARLSVIVTSNTSQVAVAQAAEGDVDVFIAKPYSLSSFRNAMSTAAMTKLQPSDYVKAIQEGRKHLGSSNLADAMRAFEKATSLDPKPSLAYFYRGFVNTLSQAVDEAQRSYLKGLEYNDIHYRCLQGLYDTLTLQRDEKGAYLVLRRIVRHFPISAQRFLSVIRLAIKTGNYDDIDQYYQLFLETETKTEDMVRYVCAALITAGKFFLRKGDRDRAFRQFQQAGVSCGGKELFLSELIRLFMDMDRPQEADKYLTRFSEEARQTTEFVALDYWVMSRLRTLQAVLEHGRKLVRAGVIHPLVHETLIGALFSAGQVKMAEELCTEACRRWPERALHLRELCNSRKGLQSS